MTRSVSKADLGRFIRRNAFDARVKRLKVKLARAAAQAVGAYGDGLLEAAKLVEAWAEAEKERM